MRRVSSNPGALVWHFGQAPALDVLSDGRIVAASEGNKWE